jgi:MbtH protein
VTLHEHEKGADMTNPFEDENGIYHVLINEEGQHSLWPSFVEVPKGWVIIHESDSRAACLDFINRNWTDMRPNSLIEKMRKQREAEQQAGGQPAEPASSGTMIAGTDTDRPLRTVH